MAEPGLEPDNAFWRFSLAVYAAPGVQAACLALQDRLGLDVNLALFCAWVGVSRGVALGAEELVEAAALARTWQQAVVAPLRAVRRALKPMGEPAAAALRGRVAALELEAERLQQAALFRLAQARWPDRAAPPVQGLALRNLRLLLPADADAPGAAALLAAAAEAHGSADA
jgi:uncharacterized protein (TIGR02444 family)